MAESNSAKKRAAENLDEVGGLIEEELANLPIDEPLPADIHDAVTQIIEISDTKTYGIPDFELTKPLSKQKILPRAQTGVYSKRQRAEGQKEARGQMS